MKFNKDDMRTNVYLIQSGNYYKIGHSRDLENRFKSYTCDNPDWDVIDTFIGVLSDESALQELCKKFHYRNEWFHNQIKNIWDNYNRTHNVEQEMEKVLCGILIEIDTIKWLIKNQYKWSYYSKIFNSLMQIKRFKQSIIMDLVYSNTEHNHLKM